MSIETAMAALNTPSVSPEPATQQQAISPKEVAAATVEQETNAKNDSKLAESAASEVKTESGVDAKSAEAPKTEPLSAKFSALTKKEKSIQKQSQEIKAKEATFAEREAKIAAREAKIAESEALWETNMFEAIKARTGLDYNGLTNAYLEGRTNTPQETDPVKLAKQTIEDFKKEQAKKESDKEAATKKAQEETAAKQKAELEEAWEKYNIEVQEFVSANKDTYELISTYEQQNLIAETVDEFYKKNKRVLSVKEAADLVESYLESEAKKAFSTKKFGTQKQEAAKKDAAPVEPKPTKTLNNSMQPTAASVLPAQSESDRMKRAMAALENNKR